MSYIPRAGSVAARVIEHLSQPDAPEAITAQQVAELCGFSFRQVGTRLGAAISNGALERYREGARFWYRLPRTEAAETAENGVAFEACIWDNGEVYLFGADPIAVNGMPGVRLTHEQAGELERLLRARAQG